MPCPRTRHLNNVPRLRGEKHHISPTILHQAGFETAWQAATSAERHALTIAPCPCPSDVLRGMITGRLPLRPGVCFLKKSEVTHEIYPLHHDRQHIIKYL